MEKRPFEEGFLLTLIILALAALVWLFSPFWQALFLAMILATASYPAYEWMQRRWRLKADHAALAATLAMLLVLVLPLAYLLVRVSLEAGAFYGNAQSWLAQLEPNDLFERVRDWLPLEPEAQAALLHQLQQKAGVVLGWVQKMVVGTLGTLVGSTVSFLSFIALAMFALFFLYRDGATIARKLEILSPLENTLDRLLMRRFTALSTVLVMSVAGVALLQGGSFALLAWLLGLPGLFVGVAIAVASFIPVVGAALVWVPLSVWLLAQGHWVSALLIAFWGAVVAGFVIDNIARPLIIQRLSRALPGGTELGVSNHTFVTILSTLAGLIHFGVLGLLFGPVMAAMAITVFEVYEYKHGHRLDRA